MHTLKITAIVGSLRNKSVNGAVARAAIEVGSTHAEIELFSVADVPLYNGDIEQVALPATVQALHDSVGAADGVLLFSPEYNGSFPAVTKNAIDWLSRPPRGWEGTPISMVVTTPGVRAGASLRTHFEAIMAFQPVRLFPSLGIGTCGEKIADGELSDTVARAELGNFVASFADFCRQE